MKTYITSESVTEGHPLYLCDEYISHMGAIIPEQRKQEAIQFIRENNGKISQREMARRLGIGKTSINRWCTELGFHPVKFKVNENFFHTWNESSAYILGFIFADGNIAWNPKKSYRTLTITASEKDANHLERIRNLLSSTKPLIYSPKTKSYRLTVANKKICKKLMSLGVIPRKSLKIRFPKIPKMYLNHFIRGVIDGDGNVRYVNRKRSPYFEITVSSGSKKFLKEFAKAIKEKLGINAQIRQIAENTYLVQYSCRKGKELAKFVYANANIYLERKFFQYKHSGGVGVT